MELNTLHRLLCQKLADTPERELPAESLLLQATGANSFRLWIEQEQKVTQFSLFASPHTLWVTQAGKRWQISLQDTNMAPEHVFTQTPNQSAPAGIQADVGKAAMTATLMHCALITGQTIQPGQALYSLSAMKMQMVYYAPEAGIITAVHATNGDTLSQGQRIFDWEETR